METMQMKSLEGIVSRDVLFDNVQVSNGCTQILLFLDLCDAACCHPKHALTVSEGTFERLNFQELPQVSENIRKYPKRVHNEGFSKNKKKL